MRLFESYATAVAAATVLAPSGGRVVASRLHSSMTRGAFLAPCVGRTSLASSQRCYHRTTRILSSSFEDSDPAAATDPADFATTYHAPVMWRECVNALLECQRGLLENDDDERPPLVFVDGTLGGGGHSSAILERLRPGDVLLGCDMDPTALTTASERLKPFTGADPSRPLFLPVHANFRQLLSVLPSVMHPVTHEPILAASDGLVDGMLLDLGVSSHQIDTAERGFAFMKDGPLDMRMSGGVAGGVTAADICNEFAEDEIRQILKTYGDEPRARAIARSIVEHRPLATTAHLKAAVAAIVPEFDRKFRRRGRTATLARVFQSLRIVVNQEDVALNETLVGVCPRLIRPGGRLVVLSYHSMEDRSTKRVMRDGTILPYRSSDSDRDLYGNYVGTPKPWKSIGKRQKASEEEVESNSRSRSATLRVAERSES